jgi:hypothetical protein
VLGEQQQQILHETAIEMKNEYDAGGGTSKLYDTDIKRPSKSHEIVPLMA